MVVNLTSHDASERVDSPCIEESTHCPCILKAPRVVTPNRDNGEEESTDTQHFHHHSHDDHQHHITTTPPTRTQPPPYTVIASPTTGRSYAIQRMLVQDKTDVSVYMGAPIHYDAHTNRPAVLSTQPVVIKRVQLGGQAGEQVLTELKALRVLSSSGERPCHVVPLLDVIRSERSVHLISPYMDSGDLFEQVRAVGCAGGLPEREVRRYFRHIMLGLMYLRRHGIAHGDVSLENTMLCSSGGGEGHVAHLIDLGSCCVVDGPKGMGPPSDYTFKGKPSYVPPEAVGLSGMPEGECGDKHSCEDQCHHQQQQRHHEQQKQQQDQRQQPQQHHCHQHHQQHLHYGHDHPPPQHHHHHSHHQHTQPPSTAKMIDPFAADVWSLAVCLYAMLTGHPLYTSPTDPAFMVLVEGRADELLEHYEGFGLCLDPLAQDLVLSMLNVCPASRPSYAELLEHPWMRGWEGEEGGGAVEMDKVLSRVREKERWGAAMGN